MTFKDIVLMEDMYTDVGKIIRKKLNSITYFDERLFREDAEGEFEYKDYIIYYKESKKTSDGETVYKYNFTFKD